MAASVDAKLLKQTKFPPEFSRKVDMTKVNIEVMKKWIAGKISEILGNEDDVVIELCFNLLEGSRFPDVKSLQIQLTGFLDKDTAKFCKELWSLCLSAQENPQGVPKELLEAKKLELIQEKASYSIPSCASHLLTILQIEAEKAAEEARRQKEQERVRERELEELRRRERSERGRGGRRGGRGGRDFDRRRSRDRFQDRPSRREFDSYVPSGSRRNRRPSRSREPNDRSTRRRRSSPYSSRADKKESTADFAKARKNRDDRRLSRSRSRNRDDTRRRRYSRSISRNRSRSRERGRSRSISSSPRRHDSRSRSRSHNRERKRRRSLQRYAPAARRRRNTSSVSVRSEKRQRMTDQEDNSAKRSSPPPEKPSSSDHEMKDPEEKLHSIRPRAPICRTELREKLLREKIVAMRRTASSDKVSDNS
ncbi:PWI domain mRNA processing protein [Aspergillus flavus AF70]|nr:PWI domain mRNA processing protein [Aspergillus flavus AF70]